MSYHLHPTSIRVPLHDTGWDGLVCAATRMNGSCLNLNLKRIAENRDDYGTGTGRASIRGMGNFIAAPTR